MKCGQNGCTKDATHIVYWPGQTTYQCESDKDRLVATGAVLGIIVDWNPIEVKDAKETDDDTSSIEDSGVSE